MECNLCCGRLPFQAGHFDVVVMLAVLEHVDLRAAEDLTRDIHRILAPGGILVLTTPTRWGQAILVPMSWLGLVSLREVRDHKVLLGFRQIATLLQRAGFRWASISHGFFELRANLWVMAIKSPAEDGCGPAGK